jgi:hypothetical protein
MESLLEFKTIQENTESLITILTYDKKKIEIIKILEVQLEKAKKITHFQKKTRINNRIYSLLQRINDCPIDDEQIFEPTLFLISDKTIEYKLNSKELKIVRDYSIPTFFIACEDHFLISYFYDIFYNFEFIYSIYFTNNNVSISEFNKNKEKEIFKKNIKNDILFFEEIDNLKQNIKNPFFIVFGKSSLFDKIKTKNRSDFLVIAKEYYSRSELYCIYEIENMKKNHILLEKKLNDLQNTKTNTDLYIFGKLKKDFQEAIESYQVKELYIEENKLEKLKSFINHDLLNFTIIPIQVLEKGDVADLFIQNYNGLMGIKYYAI